MEMLPMLIIFSIYILYLVYTLIIIIKKRRDGNRRIKTSISMFIFGLLYVCLMILGFINYSNATRFGGDGDEFATQAIVALFLSAYLFTGGIFLIRKSDNLQ